MANLGTRPQNTRAPYQEEITALQIQRGVKRVSSDQVSRPFFRTSELKNRGNSKVFVMGSRGAVATHCLRKDAPELPPQNATNERH